MKTVYRVTKNLLEVKTPWPKRHRSFDQQMIPKKLIELAKSGTYYDSKVINPVELEKPVIGTETPIGREFREMMDSLRVKTYSPNSF